MQIKVINNVFLRTHTINKARGDIWFIHGYGESGFSFREAFSSKLAQKYNLFVLDFPGFGSSPLQPDTASLENSADLLVSLIEEVSKKRSIYLVAHSLGGIVGTWVCQKLSERIKGFVNIEGNLTRSDAFFSSLCEKYKTSNQFYDALCNKILKMMGNNESLQRYYSSLRQAHPDALMAWGKSALKYSHELKSGTQYCELSCKTVYFWGDKRTSPETLQWIEKNSLPNKLFSGSDHWPMIDQTDECYNSILAFFDSI